MSQKQNQNDLKDLYERSLKKARRHTTDEKMAELLASLYVEGYKEGFYEATEKALKTLLDERNKAIQGR